MTSLEALVIILVLIFSQGHKQHQGEVVITPPTTYCNYDYSYVLIQHTSKISGRTYRSQMDLTRMSRSEAENYVRNAYYFWGEQLGAEMASWWVAQARKQGVYVHLHENSSSPVKPIARIEFAYNCW